MQQRYGDKEALRIAKLCGADAVDFSLDTQDCRKENSAYAKNEDQFTAYYSDLKQYADSIGLVIGMTHGRVPGFKNIKEEDDALIENARLDCYATALLGAPICVIHGVTTIFHKDTTPALMHDLNFDMFNRILPYAKKYGIKVATETFGDAPPHDLCDFFGNIDEFIKSYNRVCAVADYKDYYVTCADTGHSNKASRFGNPKPADVIRMLGGSLKCLHLNDNDTLTDQHKPLTTGCIDCDDVFDALDEVDYQGNYNLELNLTHVSRNFAVEEGAYAIRVLKEILRMRAAGERIKG
jgi:sugar phosphate isomerase/epimerase